VHRFKIGDVGASRAAALRVLELSASEIGFATTVAQLMIGITAHWRGQPAAGRRALAEAVRHARQTGNRLATAYALGYLALGAVDGGALEEASRAVPVALDAAEEPNVAEHFVAVIPHLAAAALHAASGRTEGAAQRGAGRLELAAALAAWAQAEAVMGCDTQRELEHARAIARACADPGEVVQRLSASAYRARLPTTTVERRPTPSWAPVSANCCAPGRLPVATPRVVPWLAANRPH
jgi:MalT-like TPR region